MKMVEYLKNDPEEYPAWLRDFKPGDKVNISEVLQSRLFYYPGAGRDGQPISVLNRAHAVHVFILVDYWFDYNEANSMFTDTAFSGYHIIHSQDVSKAELDQGEPVSHFTKEEHRYYAMLKASRAIRDNTKGGFCFLKILERDGEFDEEHGAERFAILFLGADAYPAYDALFGCKRAIPFAVLAEDYGYGNAYAGFEQGSPLELIALRTGALPKYLISPNDDRLWEGYMRVPDVESIRSDNRNRKLYIIDPFGI